MTTSTSVQNSFIDAIHSWLSSGLTSTPFGDRFEDDTGANSANEARPVVGGNLAVCFSLGSKEPGHLIRCVASSLVEVGLCRSTNPRYL